MIAVVQPHRYTRLQTLFEPFCTCFNDADAVIVAHVYPAGEAPIEGADRDHWSRRCARAAIASVSPLDGADKLAGIIKGAGASRATTWSASAPATSRNGPTRCRVN